MEQWYELEQIIGDVHLSNEPDTLIWKYNSNGVLFDRSNGVYPTSSLYATIKYRGDDLCTHTCCLVLGCAT